jgi:hypothetical protein
MEKRKLCTGPSASSPKSLGLRCVQNGPPARRSEPDWQLEGAYLKRYVTDPAGATQARDSRRPIFNATLWAAAKSKAIAVTVH